MDLEREKKKAKTGVKQLNNVSLVLRSCLGDKRGQEDDVEYT
jgi:hypothetical protein